MRVSRYARTHEVCGYGAQKDVTLVEFFRRVTLAFMTYSLKKRSKAKGVVPAAASLVVPGVGQLINGQGTKAVTTFGVAMATGAAFMTGLPLLGGIIGAAHLVTHAYAVGDAYIQARKKR